MASSPRPFDVVFGWDPMMQRIVQSKNGKEIISAQQFQDMAGVTYPLILVADKSYIAKNRETVQRFVNAYAKAQKYIRTHPDDALRMYSDAVRKAGATLDESIIKTMMFEVPKFGGVNFVVSDWTKLPNSRDFLYKNGQIKTKPEIKEITDPSFADAAEANSPASQAFRRCLRLSVSSTEPISRKLGLLIGRRGYLVARPGNEAIVP